MICGFYGTGNRFRGPQPGDEATRLLARLDQVQAFLHFAALHAPAEFVRLFRDFEYILHEMILSHNDWQAYEDFGQELAGILEVHRRRFKENLTASGISLLSQRQIETGQEYEATIKRVIELWQAFDEVKP